jgi:hypothetical protein
VANVNSLRPHTTTIDDADWKRAADSPRILATTSPREDGTGVSIDATGAVHPMPIEYNSNGQPYLRVVHDEAGTDFHLWLSREICHAFRGGVPDGYRAFHVDGNRANRKPSNLEIRPKSRSKSRFRLPPKSKGGQPTSA